MGSKSSQGRFLGINLVNNTVSAVLCEEVRSIYSSSVVAKLCRIDADIAESVKG